MVTTKSRTKLMEQKSGMAQYNKFCNSLREGAILYNMDKANLWGEYLLVAAKSSITLGGYKTYFILLLGLEKENKKFKSTNLRINITPDKADNLPYLKYVGHCKYSFLSNIENEEINNGLVDMYRKTDLWKYNHKMDSRKPRVKKYDDDGSLRIKPTSNM